MDTFRVKIPHPQPVANEDEFVTNSGRRIKRPIVNATPDPQRLASQMKDDDMLGSGMTILSPSLSTTDDQLSNSVQAELHLSLERLSENYDPDDFKRLQEKSKNSRMILTQREKKNSLSQRRNERNEGGDAGMLQNATHEPISTDSLDAEDITQSPGEQQAQEIPIPPCLVEYREFRGEFRENSEEFILSGEESEEHTIVADSLNYSSPREGNTSSKRSERYGSVSTKTLVTGVQPAEDQYADLRYNPHWREFESQNKAPPMVIDFNTAPRLDDSLEQPLSSQRGGGAIIVQKKELYSPLVPEWGKEQLNLFNSRSISPTRLSADPRKLLQTNAKYEDEFNKMLEAEILNEGIEPPNEGQPRQFPDSFNESRSLRKGNFSVLTRKLDSQDRSKHTPALGFREEAVQRIGGYQLLPDRHQMPSPTRGPSLSEMTMPNHQRIPKQIKSPGRYQSPDEYYSEKKDPLVALSPRDKRRYPLAPTPPKMPKPKNIDYVELNRQRVARKTNSAGYLEIHKKRFRQVESRSQSDLKDPIQHDYGEEMQSPEAGFPLGTVEGIWTNQAERLKIAKAESVNKGKASRQSPNTRRNGPRSRPTFLISPNQQNHYWDDSLREQPANNGWLSQNQEPAVWNSRSHYQNNRDLFRLRQPLPIPSQQAPQPSPRQRQSILSPNKEELMDSLNESGLRRAYFSPRIHPSGNDEDSPLMKAYYSKYSTEAYEPSVYQNRGNALRQNFSEQNLALPTQETLTSNPEVWANPNAETELPPTNMPLSNHSNGRPTRKVTFLGDNESIAFEGIFNGDPVPAPPPGAMHRLNRNKVPLPPTPPSKSLRHALNRGNPRQSEGKENEEHYDVREDNYPVLPPILKSHQKTGPLKQSPNNRNADSPKSSEAKGSYLQQHEKQKKKLQYKIYTLNDYQNLKKDVKLGGLGPDLENAREKLEKVEKAKKYAELIRKEHMSNATVIRPREKFGSETEISYFDDSYHFTTNTDEKQRKEMLEKRKRALEYSKTIPKPKPKPNSSSESRTEKQGAILSDYSLHHSPSSSPTGREGVDFNWGLLQMLKERHEREKAEVATFTSNG